jgi:diguanylate cyclase (GGDEF)-like protein
MARFGAILFGAGAIVTVLGLVLPHQPQVDDVGLQVVVAASALMAAALLLWGERAPDSAYMAVVAIGTLIVSLGIVSNGERHGGAAGGDEMYYMWVVLYAAYFLNRWQTALQVVLVAVSYSVVLVIVDPGDVAVSRWISTVGLVVGSAMVVRLLSERIEALVASLREAARKDTLTGLANRLAYEEVYERELARMDRAGDGFALLLADLDGLKEINDRHGHGAGDEALCAVGGALRDNLRASDFGARIGGDEFAVLLPGTDRAGAEQFGERLARALCEAGPTERSLGLSYGVAIPGEDGLELHQVMRAADDALYERKRDNGARQARTRRAAKAAAGSATSG